MQLNGLRMRKAREGAKHFRAVRTSRFLLEAAQADSQLWHISKMPAGGKHVCQAMEPVLRQKMIHSGRDSRSVLREPKAERQSNGLTGSKRRYFSGRAA